MKRVNQSGSVISLAGCIVCLCLTGQVARAAEPVLEFTGDGSYIDLGSPDALHMVEDTPFTIEGWVKLNSFSSVDMLYSRRASRGSGNYTYMFGSGDGNKMRAYIGHGGSPSTTWRDVTLNPVLETNRWYHLAFSFDGEEMVYYLDGVAVGTNEFRYSDHEGYQVMIGGYADASDVDGSKSDVRVWDHARGQGQIQTVMTNRLTGAETGLLGYWPLNEGSGSTVYDRTFYETAGTVINAEWSADTDLDLEPADIDFQPAWPFTLADIETGSTDFTNSNEVDIVDFPIPDGYDQFQITEEGDIESLGAWTSTSAVPADTDFAQPSADSNITLYAWFTNETESVALRRGEGSIFYTESLPVPDVRTAVTIERLPSEDVVIYPAHIDAGSTGGVAGGGEMGIVARATLCANDPGCDQTPGEPYVTIDTEGDYDILLWLQNEAGNTIVGAETCTVSVVAYSGTNHWTGEGATDSWHDGANWSAGLPQAGQDVRMESAPDARLTGATAALSSFYLATGRTLTVEGWESALQATNMTIAGTVTHAANHVTEPDEFAEWVPIHRVWLMGSNLTIAASGELDADSLGYPPEAGPGAASGSGGAGHAGQGRRGFGGSSFAPAYGDPDAPWQPGSGGGPNGNSRPGGGSIRIEATGQLNVEGQIRARGQNAAGTHGRGASGGSIWLTCHTFSGTQAGWIAVTGGNGNHYGAGASAGRIALHYDTQAQAALAQPVPSVRFSGQGGARGSSTEMLPAAMSTLYLPDTLFLDAPLSGQRFRYTRLVIPGFSEWAVNDLTLDDCVLGLPDGMQLTVANHLVLTNNAGLHLFAAPVSDPLTEAGASVDVGGDLKIFSGSWLHPYVDNTNGATVQVSVDGNLLVAEGGGIDADYLGYTVGEGPGVPANNRGGPGYGGAGGQGYDGNQGTAPYGEVAGPIEAGSASRSSTLGGQGGGAIRLYVAGKAEIHGLLTARGAPGIANHGPGGSGGGIKLVCQTFEGSGAGLLRVDGGRGSYYGGSGGGGRIALQYDTTAQAALPQQPQVRFRAFTQPDTTHYSLNYKAEMGTLSLPDTRLLAPSASNPVILDAERFWYTRLMLPDLTWSPAGLLITDCVIGFEEGFHLNVQDNLTLGANSGLHLHAAPTNALYGARLDVAGHLTIEDGGWLSPHAHGVEGSIVGLFVNGNVTVDAGGGIDAEGKGWFPVSGNSQGDGAGGNADSGGGYGGHGGGTSGGSAYGLAALPLEPGSPGGWRSRGGFTPTGKGGGAIHLIAGGNAQIDGMLSADGYNGQYYFGPGGSGGSILLAANRVRGTGTLRARGRTGGANRASGGGGRIAVWMQIPRSAIMQRVANVDPGQFIEVYPYAHFHGDLDVDTLGASTVGPAEAGTKGFYTVHGTMIMVR